MNCFFSIDGNCLHRPTVGTVLLALPYELHRAAQHLGIPVSGGAPADR